MENISVNGKIFEIIKLLGKGKGGYSYLVTDGECRYVVKQIHHEPCAYYTFGNKLQSELNDYNHLKNVGVLMPMLIDVDLANERLLKQYIEGDTIYDLVLRDEVVEEYFVQMRQTCAKLYAANTNIDYFPTNFVVNSGKLYYVDYECNEYHDEWNFENWGIKYWSKTPEFLTYLSQNGAKQ